MRAIFLALWTASLLAQQQGDDQGCEAHAELAPTIAPLAVT